MILTLTGPSAGGKTTLEAALAKRGFGRAISHTTRDPRAGEVCGEHYHFINNCTFDAMHARGDFIEVIDLGTRRYAMSAASLEAAADKGHVVIVVEPHGASQIRDYCLAHKLPHRGVWVACTPEEQARRWLQRYADDARDTPKTIDAQAANEKAACERLALMLSVEQEWKDGMTRYGGTASHPHLYQLWVDTTNKPVDTLAEQIDSFVQVDGETRVLARQVISRHYDTLMKLKD